jgi:hypothetical protein
MTPKTILKYVALAPVIVAKQLYYIARDKVKRIRDDDKDYFLKGN